jgi:hypothetical protein
MPTIAEQGRWAFQNSPFSPAGGEGYTTAMDIKNLQHFQNSATVPDPYKPAYDPSKRFIPLPPAITIMSKPLLPNYGKSPKATINTIRRKNNTYRERGT